MNRRTLLALGALCLLTLPAAGPARSAPPAEMRGSYFGSFTSSGGTTLNGDLTIHLHDRRSIAGALTVGGVIQGLQLGGKCAGNGSFTANGFVQQGGRRVRLRLTGVFNPGGNGELATLTGTYTLRGAEREAGTFSLSGASNLR